VNVISRRRFLATAALGIAATRLRGQSSAQATLRIPTEANGPHMPDDYIGLSYEVQQLVDPSFFSAENAARFRDAGDCRVTVTTAPQEAGFSCCKRPEAQEHE
jgi:hypothetical protein